MAIRPGRFRPSRQGVAAGLAAGYLYALHEGQDLSTALWWGTCAAAASLRSPTASDGVASLRACLARGRRQGAGAPDAG
jgi:hypothetical protein